jgi:hypothetical protein
VATYRVLRGIDYPPSKRAEPGDVVSDLPERSVKWLLSAGCIAEVDEPKSKGRKRAFDEDVQAAPEEPVDGEELD